MPSGDAITVTDWVDYLRGAGLVELGATPEVEPMSTGVSGDVVRVGDLVCKQPEARLRVATVWEADRDRVIAEALAIEQFPGIAPPFVAIDRDRFVLVQRWVPGTTWKDHLLRGRVDPDVAARAGSSLRAIHAADATQFASGGAHRFRQLRLEPYFEASAARLPELADAIRDVIVVLTGRTDTVVHGDFSPKNMLVAYDGDHVRLTVIDWEVVHAGHPLFDVAFLLTHLRAKAMHLPHWAGRFAAAEAAFLDAYGPVDTSELAPILGAILVARVDGRSPLEYLDDTSRPIVRAAGRALLMKEASL